VKFYTEDGVWDLVGNNTPIFFIRDPLLFPVFIHTQKRNPATHLKVTVCLARQGVPSGNYRNFGNSSEVLLLPTGYKLGISVYQCG